MNRRMSTIFSLIIIMVMFFMFLSVSNQQNGPQVPSGAIIVFFVIAILIVIYGAIGKRPRQL